MAFTREQAQAIRLKAREINKRPYKGVEPHSLVLPLADLAAILEIGPDELIQCLENKETLSLPKAGTKEREEFQGALRDEGFTLKHAKTSLGAEEQFPMSGRSA